MKAAVLTSTNHPLRIVNDLLIPSHLKKGQVLVRLAFSGVCHSQLMEVSGSRGEDLHLPHLLGHEGTGIVVNIGEAVSKVRPGDKVILGWIKGNGLDSGGTTYSHHNEQINGGGVTTFNEFAVVSENRLVPLPEGVPMDVGVLFGCAIPTGAGIVMNEIQPKENSSIAIFGLGGIGLSALMATMLYKCNKVIAIDVSDDKLKLAYDFGATHIINSMNVDVEVEIKKLTQGQGVDYSIDASGKAFVIEQAFNCVRRNGGLCIFASHPHQGDLIKIDPYELICGKNIRGSWGGACKPDSDIPKFAKLYLDGLLPLEKLITKRYKLDQINEALCDLKNKQVTRPLIEISPNLN
jgi:S-(hydroxymethyl)glutathione dehydrogenase/alcohol dehydrogenase